MGLGAENGAKVVVESWDVSKSKGRKKKKKEVEGVVEEEETGCWVGFRFIGSCISSRSKVDTSVSGTSTNYGNLYFPASFKQVLFFLQFIFMVHLCLPDSGWHKKKVEVVQICLLKSIKFDFYMDMVVP